MKPKEIDLQKFASIDRARLSICAPWTQGKWSYAANGHIAVRVPRREDITERDKFVGVKPPDGAKLFRRFRLRQAFCTWIPAPALAEFDMRERARRKPGQDKIIPQLWAGRAIAYSYARMIAQIPGAKLRIERRVTDSQCVHHMDALVFRSKQFGLTGVIMPVRVLSYDTIDKIVFTDGRNGPTRAELEEAITMLTTKEEVAK